MPFLTTPDSYYAASLKVIRFSVLVLTLSLLLGRSAKAADQQWTGTANTTWTNNSNWTSNAPGIGDNAVFNSGFTNQPNVSGSNALGGLWMTGSVGQNVTIAGSGTLQLGGNTINGTAGLGLLMDNASAYTLTINAAVQLTAAQTWTNNSGNLFIVGSGGVNLNSHAFTINGSGNTTISGVFSGGGAFVKAGSGTLTLSNASNTYTGQLTVQGGTLSVSTINNTSTAGSLGNNALTVILGGAGGSTGTLAYTGATVSRNKTFTLATGGTGAFQVATGGTTLTLSGVIDGAGSLAKSGSGTLILSGANSYTGATTISDGTLQAVKIAAISGNSSIGNAATAVVLGGATTAGTLRYTGAAVTYTRGFTVNAGGGGITNAGAGLLTIGTGAIVNGGNLTFATNANGITAGSVISGTGSVTLNSGGAGALTLAGVNTYGGGTILTQGTVQVSGAGTLGANSGALTIDGGTLDLNGTSQGVGNLTGAGGTIVNNASGTNVTLTIGNGDATGGDYAGVIANNSGGTGTVALTKTGTGILSLSGANTYTGETAINGGTLIANADGALGSATKVTINAGGTLLLGVTGSNDRIGNAAEIAMAGGTLNTGGNTETVGALTLTADSTIDFGTGANNLTFDGASSLGSSTLTILNWSGTFGTTGGTDQLLFTNSSFVGGATTNQIRFNIGGIFYDAEFLTIDANTVEAVGMSVVPEPSTIFSVSLLGILIGWRERNRMGALAQSVVCWMRKRLRPRAA